MTMKTAATAPRYLVKIWYEEPDQAYMAEVPALPGCVSYGDTYAEAALNVEEAMGAWLDSAHRHKDPVPEPDLAAEEIAGLGPILNVAKLARQAGLNQHTLASKLRRKTPFSDKEAKAIRKALRLAS